MDKDIFGIKDDFENEKAVFVCGDTWDAPELFGRNYRSKLKQKIKESVAALINEEYSTFIFSDTNEFSVMTFNVIERMKQTIPVLKAVYMNCGIEGNREHENKADEEAEMLKAHSVYYMRYGETQYHSFFRIIVPLLCTNTLLCYYSEPDAGNNFEICNLDIYRAINLNRNAKGKTINIRYWMDRIVPKDIDCMCK